MMPKKRRNSDFIFAILVFLTFGLIKFLEEDLDFWYTLSENEYDGKF
jgi:hypothetical protein